MFTEVIVQCSHLIILEIMYIYIKYIGLLVSGGRAIAIPGEVSGYYAAWRRFGRVEWRELFRPAISVARDGVPVGSHLSNAIQSTAEHPQLR